MKSIKTSDLAERLKKRLSLEIILIFCFMAAVAVSLIVIQIIHGRTYAQTTINRSRSVTSINARRGDILDRNNVLLATSTLEYKLILDPVIIMTEGSNYLDITSQILQRCFDIPLDEIQDDIQANPQSRYVVMRDKLTYNDVKDFAALKEGEPKDVIEFLGLPEDYKGDVDVEGAWLEESYRRNYTYDTFACSVLGFVNNDRVGECGIEKYYNSELTGIDGRKYTFLGNDNLVENTYREAEDGDTIQLTIDYNIQSIVEKYVMEMLEESGAKSVAVTIQDPDNGEFLAMADSGIFDPNNPRDLTVRYSDEEIKEIKADDARSNQVLNENWANFCVSSTFEPGSTFKAFTVAAGLEEGLIEEDSYFYCDGSVPLRDYIIHCADIDGHGDISLTDAMAQSCNMAMMDIAKKEGVDIFTKYQGQFGFGPLTDIDLPNETNTLNLMRTRENMTDIDLATYSFGQGFNVTMVQMSSAFSALINGGTYYKPYVAKGIYNAGGELVSSVSSTVVSRPISLETCSFVKKAMRHVVTDGTGTDAAVPGYITAGKTGTAQKGHRDDDLWVASFIGFAPYEHPELVCYVVIDEPASGGDGSSVFACELFSRIMSEVLPYINAVPAEKDWDPTGQGSPKEPDEEDTEENGEDGENEDNEDENEENGEDENGENDENGEETADENADEYTDEYVDEYDGTWDVYDNGDTYYEEYNDWEEAADTGYYGYDDEAYNWDESEYSEEW